MSVISYEDLVYDRHETEAWEKDYKLNYHIYLWRSPQTGEICLANTAKLAGVQLSIQPHHLRATLNFLSFSEENPLWLKMYRGRYFEVKINEELPALDRARCLAHELGHLLLFKSGMNPPRDEEEYYFQERFSEYFARQMVQSGGGTLPYTPPLSGNEFI